MTKEQILACYKVIFANCQRAKVTKCEYLILRKFYAVDADEAKKKRDSIAAVQELIGRPWMVDFTEHVFCQVQKAHASNIGEQ